MSLGVFNPYLSHAQLSPIEQDVLWEYVKLGDKIKRIAQLSKVAAQDPNEPLLTELRALEKKMGLVLTLFKASVWGVMQESQAVAEAEEARRHSNTAGRWDDSS